MVYVFHMLPIKSVDVYDIHSTTMTTRYSFQTAPFTNWLLTWKTRFPQYTFASNTFRSNCIVTESSISKWFPSPSSHNPHYRLFSSQLDRISGTDSITPPAIHNGLRKSIKKPLVGNNCRFLFVLLYYERHEYADCKIRIML